MGTISNARASYGLSATGLPTKTNISGVSTIGVTQTLAALDADIAYSFEVEDGGGNFGITLDLPTGVVSIDSGAPTVSDGDGNDFEGVTLPTTVTLYAVLFEFDATAAGGTFSVASTNAALVDIPTTEDGTKTKSLYFVEEGIGGTLGTITVNGVTGLGAYSFTATIIGSST